MAPQRIFHPAPGFEYQTIFTDSSGIQWLSGHDLTILVTIDSKVGGERESEPKAAYGIFFSRDSRHNEYGLLLQEIIQQSNLNQDVADLYAALCAVRAAREYALGTPIKMVVLRTASPCLGDHINSRGEQIVNMPLTQNLHEALLSLESMGTEVSFWAMSPKTPGIAAARKLCVSALKGTPDDEQMAVDFPDPSSLTLETVSDPPSSPESSPPRAVVKQKPSSGIVDRVFNPIYYFDNVDQELETIRTDSNGLRRLPDNKQSILVDIYSCTYRPKAAYGAYFGEKSPLNRCGLLPQNLPVGDQAVELYSAIVALRVAKELAREMVLTLVVLKVAASTKFLTQHMAGVIWKWEKQGYVSARDKPVANSELFKELHGLFLALEEQGTAVQLWKVQRESNKEAEILSRSAFNRRS